MTHLIPEQRPDKNGKLVTRHIKGQVAGSFPAAMMPAPVIAVQKEPATEVIRREFRASGGMTDEEVDSLLEFYLEGKGERTLGVIADALTSAKSAEATGVIKSISTVMLEPGAIQLAAHDIDFFLDVSKIFPDAGPPTPVRKTISIFEDAFTNTYTVARNNRRRKVPLDIDYLTHAKDFQATVLARVMEVHENTESVFAARDQIDHIKENLDLFRRYAHVCREASLSMHNEGDTHTSHDLLDVCKVVDEHPGNGDAVIALIRERKRFDADEIRITLSTAAGLSRGVL